MATEILMPALTPTMEEGTLASWLVEPGDTVKRGQVIAEIETDKSVLEFEALQDGVIGELRVDAGTEGVAVDTVIAILLEPGEKAQSRTTEAEPKTDQSADDDESEPASAARPTKPGPGRKKRGRIPSSPAARRVAKEHEIDIATVEGTGPRGRVLKGDVKQAVEKQSRSASAKSADSDDAPTPEYTEERLSTGLQTMGRRMADSKATIPHLYCSIEVCADPLLTIREQLIEESAKVRITLNDLVTLATARALRDTPRMNVQYVDGGLRRFSRVDLSVAVALEEGLITPVIRAADTKSLGRIAEETRELADRAKKGRLRPEEYEGGTFTVSNVGMFGIAQSWPIINPPQAGILGVGSAAPRAVPAGDGLTVATMMSVTLSADHRVIDGAIAGAFLRSLKNYIERPAQLLL